MTDSRPADLPNFAAPPVVEVALSVQFEPLGNFGVAHQGLFWAKFRDRFPRAEDHEPIEPTFERFGPPRPARLGVRIERGPQLPRCFFINQAGTQLIQVQRDRFIHNWRKVGSGDDYPRYESIKREFLEELKTFTQFLAQERLGSLMINQCEVTYVNHLVPAEGSGELGHLEEMLTVWRSQYSDSFLREPEDVKLAIRYIIPGEDGHPIGRLLIRLDPAIRKADNRPMYVFRLTARGKPRETSLEGALLFLDVGREWIVRAFTSITSRRMHESWRRTDGA